MSHRGINQLRRIKCYFCDIGGSSKGIRSFLASQDLKNFIQNNPQIQFDFYLKRWRHPYISSIYINGFTKERGLLNMTVQQIIHQFNRFKRSSGRSSHKFSGVKVKNFKTSIQGKWDLNFSSLYPGHSLDSPPKEAILQKPETILKPDFKKQNKRTYEENFLRKKTSFPVDI